MSGEGLTTHLIRKSLLRNVTQGLGNVGSFENSSDLLGSIKAGNFLDRGLIIIIFNKDFFPWRYLWAYIFTLVANSKR
jgi:hypothetical protein